MRQTGKTKGTKKRRNGGWKWKKISQAGLVNCAGLETDVRPQWRYQRRPWKFFWFEGKGDRKTWKARQQIWEIPKATHCVRPCVAQRSGKVCYKGVQLVFEALTIGGYRRDNNIHWCQRRRIQYRTPVWENWIFLPQNSRLQQLNSDSTANNRGLTFHSIICWGCKNNQMLVEKVHWIFRVDSFMYSFNIQRELA